MSVRIRPTVIICAHAPRVDYLTRTLGALAAQSINPSGYDLIVVDNANRNPVAGRFDLTWHPSARIVTEPTVGLTNARLRGIAEASTELIVWVDDDNLLAPDYVEKASELAQIWPSLGAWGCGDFTPEWETQPPQEFSPYLNYLAVGRVGEDRWGNRPFDYASMPAGAGLCCRLVVARAYANSVQGNQRRRELGRIGGTLGACEDFDLALHAIDLGLGTAVFTCLRLTHLMPSARVQEDYLIRLVEGHARSTVLLMALRDPAFTPPAHDWKTRLRAWRLQQALPPVARRIHDARIRGERAAAKILAASNTPPRQP
jgi:glycosyltransferase involved in cell wall biosynthesis